MLSMEWWGERVHVNKGMLHLLLIYVDLYLSICDFESPPLKLQLLKVLYVAKHHFNSYQKSNNVYLHVLGRS